MKTTDLNLSLRGDTFSAMKSDFDDILGRTIGNMEMKGASAAVVTVKLDIELEKTARSTPSGFTDVVVPKFKHSISSVMQVKDKVSGQLVGDYQLVWDEKEKKYVIREIDSGQESIFDRGRENNGVCDAAYRVVPDGALPDGSNAMALPGHDDSDNGEDDGTVDNADGSCGADVLDESTPFGWLAKFINHEMRVTEAMGNYTVRSGLNKIILSAATSPDNPFFCNAETLAKHNGHKLVCVAYGGDVPTVIRIECADCGEVVFSLTAPGAMEEEIEDALKDDDDGDGGETNDGEFPEDDSIDDYPYDSPEE